MVYRNQRNCAVVISDEPDGSGFAHQSTYETERNRYVPEKLKLLTVILTGVILFFSACGMGWIVTLLSETVWIVLIFMFLGKMEYEKEIQKKAK